MQCFKRCTLAIVGLVTAIGIASAVWAASIAGILNSPDQPRNAEAIVVLGADPSRVLEAADLYKAGFAPRILLSDPMREKRFERLEQEGVAIPWFEIVGRDLLRRRGVPDDAIATFGHRLKSTAEEASTLAGLHPELKSILLVSSPYHVYRARLIFRKALRSVEVIGIGSKYEEFPTAWWKENETARNALVESVKLIFYWVGGRM
ncbi:MAG: YdcF family protein [Burkholderiales bacterium]